MRRWLILLLLVGCSLQFMSVPTNTTPSLYQTWTHAPEPSIHDRITIAEGVIPVQEGIYIPAKMYIPDWCSRAQVQGDVNCFHMDSGRIPQYVTIPDFVARKGESNFTITVNPGLLTPDIEQTTCIIVMHHPDPGCGSSHHIQIAKSIK